MRERGLLELDEPVELASGARSRHFIDGKRALAHGDDLALACRAFLQAASDRGIEFDLIGGLTMGADQFAHGVAILGSKQWFVVRKEPKGRGTNKLVEGADIEEGSRILLVDDVVTTGGSIEKAYEIVRDETKGVVVGAVTLVDRGERANKFFADHGVPYVPLLTYEDLGIPPINDGRPHA